MIHMQGGHEQTFALANLQGVDSFSYPVLVS